VKKLARFLVMSVLYVFSFMLLYSLLPFMVWAFGGSFKDVAQSVPYALFGSIVLGIGLCVVFDSSFDQDFNAK
jgi:uncharacterized membrane protein